MKRDDLSNWRSEFLHRHALEASYLDTASAWFDPLALALAQHQDDVNRPMLVALNGCQGSGKTTLSDYLCTSLTEEYGANAIALSLDDFYLTHRERQKLAQSIHPLLITRGVPGTHDMDLLKRTLEQLLNSHSDEPVAIPRFDKSTDDRQPLSDWDPINTAPQLVLLEGWCLGAEPEPADSLSAPINTLEREEDSAGLWRGYSNEVLRQDFQPLYQRVDQWIMLRAPSLDCVFEWRREQEHKLAASLPQEHGRKTMNDEELRRFIQHYERITRNCLNDLPKKIDHLFSLNAQRQVTAYSVRDEAKGSPKAMD
jgi:D-glycerate 3-kinase